MVNGNVLVPLADERTPLASDPAARALIQKFLNAYPNELPNRVDFDKRALNTNAPRSIDELTGSLRLDVQTTAHSKLLLSSNLSRQRTLAFQLVAGQNPNSDIHNSSLRAAWQLAPSASSEIQFIASAGRMRSLLRAEPNSVGPRLRFGYQIEELGPDSMFPIDRAANTFTYGVAGQRLYGGGRHVVTYGGDWTRFQLNGVESNNQRGQFQFGSNFGRIAIENLRYGTPNSYEVAVGNLSRGYRNWTANLYVADKWKLTPRLQVYYGIRYMADATPQEVHNIDKLPYSGDFNNFSPRLGLAWQAGRGWVARAAYSTTFAQLQPVTYQQIRNNPTAVKYLVLADPDLVNPLKGIDLNSPTVRYSPTWMSSDLASPYAHQYNAVVEHKLKLNSLVRMSYIGSRTFQLLNCYMLNRARPVDGIALTTATVNERRPDARYYDTRLVTNGGMAWMDAGQVAWDVRSFRGVVGSISYTLAKAIDQGPDYSRTGANRDVTDNRSQSLESLADRKGLSNFDSPHTLMFSYSWNLPALRQAAGWVRTLVADWQVSGANMWKKGTPSTLFVGSDAPGFGNVDGGPGDRPNVVDATVLGATISHPDTATQILRRERFAYIGLGQARGNAGRGILRKASIWNWNAAVTRQFRLPGESLVQFRAEAYNLSNTPQFDEPQRNLSSPAFGKITNTLNDGRVFQVGFRLQL